MRARTNPGLCIGLEVGAALGIQGGHKTRPYEADSPQRDGKGDMMTTWLELRQSGYVFEDSPRRIRTLLGSTVVADSRQMRLLHPPGGRPPFYCDGAAL